MKNLTSKIGPGQSESFSVGELSIKYPGKKGTDDYQVTINGVAPKHTDIVMEIYDAATAQNIEEIISFLDDVYTNGLNSTSKVFPKTFIEKIYWVTLQEEINYPQPVYKGRRLPFQRFFEGAMAKVADELDISVVRARTNNHGMRAPALFSFKDFTIPSFYS